MGTNIDDRAIDADGELEDEQFSSDDLYPGGLALNTGIAIDIGVWSLPASSFHLVRLTDAGGTEASQVDAILRLH